MSESLTQTKVEEVIDRASQFIAQERGVELDGDQASAQVVQHALTVDEHANDLVTAVPHPKMDGYTVPLSRYNANQFAAVKATLANYVVLVPSVYVNREAPSAFYPAVVSEHTVAGPDSMRLHVYQQPFHVAESVSYGGLQLLSAAGQMETAGVGEHKHSDDDTGYHKHDSAGDPDNLEAEHFYTILGVSGTPGALTAWQNGAHINHDWKQGRSQSVSSQVQRLVDPTAPHDVAITITESEVRSGSRMLLWHQALREQDGERAGRPLAAAKHGALVVAQALAHDALSNNSPARLDATKEFLQA